MIKPTVSLVAIVLSLCAVSCYQKTFINWVDTNDPLLLGAYCEKCGNHTWVDVAEVETPCRKCGTKLEVKVLEE